MADKNIKEITGGQVTTPTADHAVEVDNGSVSGWMLLTDILKALGLLSADANPLGADYLLTWDTSASGVKKALISALILTASQISDFDTEVANNSAVSDNTSKVTNATHTGDVTGATELTIAADAVDANHIDWGTGANQVSHDDIPDGSTYVRTENNLTDTLAGNIVTNNAKVTNATHTGEVTGDGALTIADNVVDEANLKLEEAPTNDYVLTADSTKSGGMKWAAAASGFSDPLTTRGDIIIKNASNETTRLGVGTAGQLLGTDGTDVLYISKKLDDLAAPDDNTDLNASTSAHGLLPKLSNTATEFLNGQGSWATPTGNGLATQLTIDSTPDSDSTANGIKLSMTAGESVVYGDLLYQNSDGEVYKADADAAATMPVLYMALESKGNGEAVSVLKSGIARLDSWSWTVGARLFASTTPGAITATAPSGSGDQVQVIGYATHADRIDFNPSRDVLELS